MPPKMTFLITIMILMIIMGTSVTVQATTVKQIKSITEFRGESRQFIVTVVFRIKRI